MAQNEGGLALGLKRLSLVWWSFVALCATLMLAVVINDNYARNMGSEAGYAVLTLGVPYGLHRLTCWVIDGFSRSPVSPRQ